MKMVDTLVLQRVVRTCNDGWLQGWHERNGGNLTYRLSAAEVEQFLARKTASDRSPLVYRHRAQLQAIQEGLKDTRLYVVAAAPDWEVLQLNLEEKPSAGLFDLGPKPEK